VQSGTSNSDGIVSIRSIDGPADQVRQLPICSAALNDACLEAEDGDGNVLAAMLGTRRRGRHRAAEPVASSPRASLVGELSAKALDDALFAPGDSSLF